MELKTYKAAKEAGLKTRKEWIAKYLIPKRDATPVVVKEREFFAEGSCEPLVSRTMAKRRRMKVDSGAKAAAKKYSDRPGASGYFDVYRLSDCVQFRKRSEGKPPCKVDLLLAIFTINKSAKRFRDAASKHYDCSQHGFAGHARQQKRKLYALKEVGIAKAHRSGRLRFVGIQGSLAVYRGGGYCFHSTLLPEGHLDSFSTETETVRIGSVPKGIGEARLKDAEFTLSEIKRDFSGFEFLKSPEFAT